MPSRAAGMPNSLPSPAMRMSQDMAMPKPPPMQKPWILAMTGLGNSASFLRPAEVIAL